MVANHFEKPFYVLLIFQAKPFLDTNNVKELADPKLEEKYDPIEMKRVMMTASMCVHHSPSKRPFMKQVKKMNILSLSFHLCLISYIVLFHLCM